MMPTFNTYLVYALHPDLRRMQMYPRLVGKYLIHDGVIHVVEDHDGLLDGLDEQPLSQGQRRLSALMNSHYYLVTEKKPEVEKKKEVDDWENEVFGDSNEADGGQVATPSRDGVFHYHREGYDVPRVLEAKGGRLMLDGHDVSPEEVSQMMENAKKGTAKITYVNPPEVRDFKKSALETLSVFAPLQKASLKDSLAELRSLVDAGHLHPDHYKTLSDHYETMRGELYNDEMIPTLGNKRAYRDFIASPGAKGGVHAMLDGDGMKAINDTYGHEDGDKAIHAMGTALRSAIDETVGSDQAKAHRFGGDEFHFHTKTPEQAHAVLRKLNENLEKIPAFGGLHRVGFSVGLGSDPQTADNAMYHAKKAKHAEVAEMAGSAPAGTDLRMLQPKSVMRVHSLLPNPEMPLTSQPPSGSVKPSGGAENG